MHKDPYVFAQLVKFLDRSKFNRIVAKSSFLTEVNSIVSLPSMKATSISRAIPVGINCLQ